MKKMMVLVAFAACFALASGSKAQDTKKPEPKCPVSGDKIDKDASVDHNGGKVYFCCNNCPKKFAENKEKYAAKANFQLVVTGQAKQVKCFFTGGKLNEDTKFNVAGVDCFTCCFNCQGKVKDEPTAKQLEAIFNDKAFKKGFEVKKAK